MNGGQTLSVLRGCLAPATLLGPPQLRNLRPPAPTPPPASGDPFAALMAAKYNNSTTIQQRPPMGLTEKNSPTFLSSGNPCLDFFFHVVPDTPAGYFAQQLPLAWSHNALTTLKLVCNLRGVRGTGKSDKEGFYTAAFWLHQNHPKTLACNVESVAEFGYFKDLPEILYRLLEGQDVRENQKREWELKKGKRLRKERSDCKGNRGDAGKKGAHKEPREVRLMKEIKRAKLMKEEARALRKERFIAQAKKALERYQSDPDYRFLHDRISDVFAECLKGDIKNLMNWENLKFTLAAKWCPSLDSSFDRATLLCESIARKVFPKELYPEYQQLEDEHYAYRVRDRLRKKILVPLREAMRWPDEWCRNAKHSDIFPYNGMASVEMTLRKEKFLWHDKKRFEKYLDDVKEGKEQIAAGALLPHEIIHSLDDGTDGGKVAELQWKRMVEDLLKQGKMRNCLAVCDVSGSMSGAPMDVSVALGILVSELNEEPWKGNVITFSQEPKLHLIKGDSLRSKCRFVRDIDWGMNTDFQKVFDLLLEVAVNGKLKPENMIQKIFVFSDMEFDQASQNNPGYTHYSYRCWETDYEAIQRKFKEKGYGDVVPQIIFWNLRHSSSMPVTETQPGVALLSGFSKNLLKLFLNNDGEVRPDTLMEAAISGKEYHSLALVD